MQLMSIYEVADVLALAYRTVLTLIKSGQLKAYRIGGSWRVKRTDLDAYLDSVVYTAEWNEKAWQKAK